MRLVSASEAYVGAHPAATTAELLELLRWVRDHSAQNPESPTAVVREVLDWLCDHVDAGPNATAGDNHRISSRCGRPHLTLVSMCGDDSK
jgi:hypothetical protein